MTQFLDNTIYTNYALYKICRNLVEDIEDFNFIHVKVGSGDNTLYADREDLSALLYELDVQVLEFDNEEGVLTIKCEIPPDLADVPITEIGLFDMVMGYEHLFSYSKVNVVKPADLGYELTIVLNLGPRTIDFPGINSYYVSKYKYITKSVLDDFINMFLYVDTNLERIVHSNAEVIGYNMLEQIYDKQQKFYSRMQNIEYALLNYSLHSQFGNDLSDLFFLGSPNYLAYDIVNFAKPDSFLKSKYKLWDSTNDNITFNNGPLSLFFVAQFNDIKEESAIFNKWDDTGVYFKISTESHQETYIKTTSGYETATFYELVVTIMGTRNLYKIKYIFDESNVGNYVGRKVPYVLTFNGDITNNPELHLYVDGEEPEIFVVSEETEPSLTVQANITPEDSEEEAEAKLKETVDRLKTRAFGKVIIEGDATDLVGLPDRSSISLKNYLYDYVEEEKVQYINGINTNIIGTIKRQANKYELALLNNTLKSMI